MDASLGERLQATFEWYDKEPRYLRGEVLESIPWHEVRNRPVSPEIISTLFYFRDVEKLTDVYFRELLKTPTGKNAPIQAFMERWRTEEDLHGELLNRFLEEAGYHSEKDWYDKVKAAIPLGNRLRTGLSQPILTLAFGKDFSAVHMTWGAINEYCTMYGYSRLRELSGHPTLDVLLDGIMREETRHAQFYWRAAKEMLDDSPYRQKMARFFIDKFWTPVGEGSKPMSETAKVIDALFKGEEGLKFFDARVGAIIRRLPGFDGCSSLTETVARCATA